MVPFFIRSGTFALVVIKTLWHLATPSLSGYLCPLPIYLCNLREPSSNGCRRVCMASSTFLAFVIKPHVNVDVRMDLFPLTRSLFLIPELFPLRASQHRVRFTVQSIDSMEGIGKKIKLELLNYGLNTRLRTQHPFTDSTTLYRLNTPFLRTQHPFTDSPLIGLNSPLWTQHPFTDSTPLYGLNNPLRTQHSGTPL